MPRGVKKEHLPSKICVTCGRPFTWRKKWERAWDEVTTCSKSCNRQRREQKRTEERGNHSDCSWDHVNQEGDTVLRRVQDIQASAERNQLTLKEEEEQRVYEDETDDSRRQMDKNLFLSIGTNSSEGLDDHRSGYAVEIKADNLTENDLLGDEDDVDANNSDDGLELPDGFDFKSRQKVLQKAEKKLKKAARRAQREGRGDPTAGQKPCDMCGRSVNLLIRCMYEESHHPADWKMVCGKCWHIASGGVVDGDSDHPHYRYGGLWKNRRAQQM